MPTQRPAAVTFDVAKAIRETKAGKVEFAWTRRASFIARSGKFNLMARARGKRPRVINVR